jgi:hypothetical protein
MGVRTPEQCFITFTRMSVIPLELLLSRAAIAFSTSFELKCLNEKPSGIPERLSLRKKSLMYLVDDASGTTGVQLMLVK